MHTSVGHKCLDHVAGLPSDVYSCRDCHLDRANPLSHLQELASSANVMRVVQEKTRWQAHNPPLIAAIVQNATERLEKPSSNAAMQLNAQNILDIFHAAAVLEFHPQEGLFLQTVLKLLELRLQEFSAQVRDTVC